MVLIFTYTVLAAPHVGGKKGTAISLIEAHDIDILAKIERYTDQILKRRCDQVITSNA